MLDNRPSKGGEAIHDSLGWKSTNRFSREKKKMEGSEFPAPHGLRRLPGPAKQVVFATSCSFSPLFPLSGFPRARASYRRSRGYGVVGVYLPPLFQSSSPFARPALLHPSERKMCLFSDPTECTVQRASTAIERRAIADVNPLSKYLKNLLPIDAMPRSTSMERNA